MKSRTTTAASRVDAVPVGESLLLDEHQAAALLGISYWSCRELVAAGKLPLVQLPSPLNPRRTMRRKLIARSDVLALIERCKSGGVR